MSDLDDMLYRCERYGVSSDNIAIVNNEVCLNKMGIIQFFIGYISTANSIYEFNNPMMTTVVNLYNFCDSMVSKKTFFSGEFEGFRTTKKTLNCGELIDLLYSIYENKTTVMGEYFDIKDKLISLNIFLNKKELKNYE